MGKYWGVLKSWKSMDDGSKGKHKIGKHKIGNSICGEKD
jgi:hypothetical protein